MCGERGCSSSVFWTLAVVGSCFASPVLVAAEAPREQVPAAKSAPQLVTAALQAESVGKLAERAANLRDALGVNPNYPPAHWHSGEVLVDGAWISTVERAGRTAKPEYLAQYRERRETLPSSAADHLKLAHFCRDAGLVAQERLHLAKVLEFDRSHKEAISKLKLDKRQADPKEAAARAVATDSTWQKRRAIDERWKQQLTRLRDDFTGKDAQLRESAKAQLSAIRDTDAIPALESRVSISGVEGARLVVSILDKMPGAAATVSLAKHAVLSDSPEIREKAALALKSRDLYAYAPSLLAHMEMPIEVSFDVGGRYGGAVGDRLSLYQEGPNADRSFLSMHVYTPEPVPAVPGSSRYNGNGLAPPPPPPGSSGIRSRITMVRPPVEQSAAKDARVAMRAEQHNSRSKQLNERIAYVLRTATGTELPAVPTQWWRWWSNYNEMYYPDEKPIYETGSYVYRPYAQVQSYLQTTPPLPPPGTRTRSCFVAGTPVWTRSGPIAVEKLLVGEEVLSQDTETGELAYRPVMATTVRPPASALALKFADDEILVTRGHPFWVSGAGWRMAKELKAGDLLHTPDGACVVEQVDERAEYPTYNSLSPVSIPTSSARTRC